MLKFYTFYILLFLFQITQSCCYEKQDLLFIIKNNPINFSEPKEEEKNINLSITNELGLLGIGMIKLYQILLSSQTAPVCNFFPSCSQFGLLAIDKYGIILGILLTSDRVLRCNGLDTESYEQHRPTGRYYDPVEGYIP